MTPQSKRLLTRGLLASILVFFLMPFATVSCGGAKLLTMNGVQMATGTTMTSPSPLGGRPQERKIAPEPLAMVAAVIALLALGLAFTKGQVGLLGAKVGATACAVALLALKFKVDSDAVHQGQGLLLLQWEFGFWLALLAAIGAAVVAFLTTKELGLE